MVTYLLPLMEVELTYGGRAHLYMEEFFLLAPDGWMEVEVELTFELNLDLNLPTSIRGRFATWAAN